MQPRHRSLVQINSTYSMRVEFLSHFPHLRPYEESELLVRPVREASQLQTEGAATGFEFGVVLLDELEVLLEHAAPVPVLGRGVAARVLRLEGLPGLL